MENNKQNLNYQEYKTKVDVALYRMFALNSDNFSWDLKLQEKYSQNQSVVDIILEVQTQLL
ncbi:MAG: hypothetical protein WBF90_33740 [Rivularia sp. (in: cyanobacteria)]